jgi:hypothetical protein
MARRSSGSAAPFLVALAASTGCAHCSGGSAPSLVDTGFDASTDAVGDLGVDAGIDAEEVAVEAAVDAVGDLGFDAGADARVDSAPDTSFDAGADTSVDSAPDTSFDAGADARVDSAPDTSVDAGADARVDSAPDTSVDASPDVAVDAGPDTAVADDADARADGVSPDASPCTNLAGTITSLAKGRYCVTGDVIVPAGTTLSVPAGTELVFMGRYHFGRDPALPDAVGVVSGGLSAIGTAAEPIVFRGATPSTAWFGIAVSYSPDPVHLEYVTIRDAYKDDRDPNSRIWRRGGGLSSYVNEKGTILRHCQFLNDRAWMVAGALDINSNGSWPNAGPVEITDSLFEDDSCECGVYVGSADDKCGGGAIRFSHVGGPVTIERNVFRRNRALSTAGAGIPAYGGAIGAFSSLLPLGPGNLFEANSAQAADGAISCAGHAALGVNFISVDASNVFSANVPDKGCGL